MAPLKASQSRRVSYRLPALPRGRHEIGPLHLHIVDPFGLIDRRRSTVQTTSLLVVPTVETLPEGPDGFSGLYGHPASRERRAASGADDQAIRPYREGDDVRRVHWRLSARAGSLIVRQDERSAPNETAVTMDLRAVAHPVVPGPNGSPRTPSFEWMVRAAASIAAHTVGPNRPVTLYGDPAHPTGLRCGSRREVLEYLALVSPQRSLSRSDLAALSVRSSAHFSTFTLLAGLDEQLATALADQYGGHGGSHAILLDTDAHRRNAGLREDGAAAGLHRLVARGWSVTTAAPDEPVAAVWRRLHGVQTQHMGRHEAQTR